MSYDTGEEAELNDRPDLLEEFMILAFVGSIITIIALGEGNYGPMAIGIIMILLGIMGSNASNEAAKARANQRRYWAHYYDKDQVEARKRGNVRRPPAPYHDEMDELEFYETIFDDD